MSLHLVAGLAEGLVITDCLDIHPDMHLDIHHDGIIHLPSQALCYFEYTI